MNTIVSYVFDADGVLFDEENPYLAIATKLGVDKIVKEWVGEYLAGTLSYDELVQREVDLFIESYNAVYNKRPETGDLERLLPFPNLRDGVERLFKNILDAKKDISILSSGFMHLTRELTRLDVNSKKIHSNRFLYDTNGEFVTMHIDVYADKVDAFDRLVEDSEMSFEETAYIGDNAFDEVLMKHALSKGSTVYLVEEANKDFKFKDYPTDENFFAVDSINDLRKLVVK